MPSPPCCGSGRRCTRCSAAPTSAPASGASSRAGASEAGGARELIDWAIGPVWEANHVWLIFVLVVLWTGFSSAFAAIFSTLFIPLSLAALGIVLRGSGFAFHKTARRTGGRDLAERLFGLSSLLTPFFMGTVVGAIASERVPPGNAAGDPVSSWLNPALARHRRALRRHVRVRLGRVPAQRRAARPRPRPRAVLLRPRARRGAGRGGAVDRRHRRPPRGRAPPLRPPHRTRPCRS